MLVDDAHGRIYISGGRGTSDLVVTDLVGGNLQTIENVGPGPAGMTLNPDGTKLYVAASESDGITVIDTATQAITWHWAGRGDGEPTCPRDVAWASGRLWFSWGCDTYAGIGGIDPATGAFDLQSVGRLDMTFCAPPMLEAVPSQPDMVIAGDTGCSAGLLVRFRATSLLDQEALGLAGGFVSDMAITPDGSQVIVPSGAPYFHQAFRTSDLTVAHRYPTAPYPNAAAIWPDGTVAAGISGAYEEDVYIFEPGGTTPIATFEFGHLPDQETWAHLLANGGLAVHGDRLYAITEVGSEPDNLTLRVRTVG